MGTRPVSRRRLPLVLSGIAVIALLLAGAPDPHQHDHSGPGFYDPECELLALATLGTTSVLASSGVLLAVPVVVDRAVLAGSVAIAQAAGAGCRSRAPPHPSA